MTKREGLHVVNPATTVNQALEILVEKRITGFPVIDDEWKLVGLVSDCDLLALDSCLRCIQFLTIKNFPTLPSGTGRSDTDICPEVDSIWKDKKKRKKLNFDSLVVCLTTSFSIDIQRITKLLSKTNGKVVGVLMTPAPMVVHEATNLEDAARLLLQTKYRLLPFVNGDGKLIGIITRGNVVGAALQFKQDEEKA